MDPGERVEAAELVRRRDVELEQRGDDVGDPASRGAARLCRIGDVGARVVVERGAR
jgi:hypothetical protein